MNLAFVREHCRTDAHVKAVICHEFLHVLLRHTERLTRLTPAEHLAFDAVINAIIHRSAGSGLQRDDEPATTRANRASRGCCGHRPTRSSNASARRHGPAAACVPTRSASSRRGEASTTARSSPTTSVTWRATSPGRRRHSGSRCWATTRRWAARRRARRPQPPRRSDRRHGAADGAAGRRARHGAQGDERIGRVPQPARTRRRRARLRERGQGRGHRGGPLATRDLCGPPPAPAARRALDRP